MDAAFEKEYLELVKISEKSEITDKDWEKLADFIHRSMENLASSVHQFSKELRASLENIGKKEYYYK